MSLVDDNSRIMDHRRLTKDLARVASKWYDLGLQLEIPDHELSSIDSDDSLSDLCLRRVVRKLLQDTDEEDSRDLKKIIVTALKSDVVGEKKLARDVERDLKTPLTTKTLINILSPVASKWDQFGLQAGIGHDTLAKYKESYKDVKRYLKDMLGTWLKQTDPPPSLDSLFTALKSQVVGERRLAGKLQRQYKDCRLEVGNIDSSDSGVGD